MTRPPPPHAEAQAQLALARSLTVQSRFVAGQNAATRARHLFDTCADARGAAQAAALLAQCAAVRRQPTVALNAARHCAAAAVQAQSRRLRAMAHDALGLCRLWAGDCDGAAAQFEAAVWLADRHEETDGDTFLPAVNACVAEALRLHGDAAGDTAVLERLVQRATDLLGAGRTRTLAVDLERIALAQLEFASCVLAARTRRQSVCDGHYLACLQEVAGLGGNSWLQAVACWARMERARASGDAARAYDSVLALRSCAQRSGHRALETLAGQFELELRAEFPAKALRVMAWAETLPAGESSMAALRHRPGPRETSRSWLAERK